MRITRLEMQNFRGIEQVNLSFGQEPVTVLAGMNGAGKSAILDCFAILLSRLVWRIRSTTGTGRMFTDGDISNGKQRTRNTIVISTGDGSEVEWCVTKRRSGLANKKKSEQTISNLDQLKDLATRIQESLEGDPNTNIPLAVYYPVNRAVLEVPVQVRGVRNFPPVGAYDQALGSGRSDFRLFFEWFRRREDLENEFRLRSRENFEYEDPQLRAVRQAVVSLIPGFGRLRVERSPLRMVVTKAGEDLNVTQLSDGEKCLLAMVGDLARRLCIANPSLATPLHGAGVVLIDEIELHLHPGWQRMIILALQRTFPNCQFIVSTHSPQVLSDVKPEGIYLLERRPQGILVSRPENSFGRDSGRILEDLMGVPARPLEVKQELAELFRLIDDGNLSAAQQLRQRMAQEIGADEPEFGRADILMRRRLVRK